MFPLVPPGKRTESDCELDGPPVEEEEEEEEEGGAREAEEV
jgi:hypothetical protein